MKAPVWAIVGRVKIFDASTSYHRYYLIDQAIWRFNEWWLLGTKSTEHWGWGMWDITNKYVQVAVEGGLLTLVVFIMLIVFGFRYVGLSVKSEGSIDTAFVCFTFGVAWFAHSVTFIGMTYFQSQILINWLFVLAVVSFLEIHTSFAKVAICSKKGPETLAGAMPG
jgi:hypothetical protein